MTELDERWHSMLTEVEVGANTLKRNYPNLTGVETNQELEHLAKTLTDLAQMLTDLRTDQEPGVVSGSAGDLFS
jgi:hypothetical protein